MSFSGIHLSRKPPQKRSYRVNTSLESQKKGHTKSTRESKAQERSCEVQSTPEMKGIIVYELTRINIPDSFLESRVDLDQILEFWSHELS